MPQPQLVLFSGLAVSAVMLQPQRDALGDVLHVPAWLPPERGESLRSYARRWGERLVHQLDPSRPLVIGGYSFGGALALEMAPVLRPSRVVLISSCRAGRDVAWWVRWPSRAVRFVPRALARPLLPVAARVYAMVERVPPAGRRLYSQAMAEADLAVLHWAPGALVTWRAGEPPAEPGVPVTHVHGDADPIIPLRNVRPDVVVHGGPHLLPLSHPDAVNRVLRAVLDDLAGTVGPRRT